MDAYEEELKRRNRLTPIVKEALVKAARLRSTYTHIFYVAGGLTGVSNEVKKRYERLSQVVMEDERCFGYAPHLHGTDPIAHPDVTPNEVRDVDFLFSVIVPHYHINCLHPVAHGNAVEAGWAETANIPTIHLVPVGFIASRLIRGMWNIAKVIEYQNFEDDALPAVQNYISEITN